MKVFVANAGQMPSLTGVFGVSLIMNLTTSMYTYNYTPRGTTNVGGSEAEWIMERPTVNGSLGELANYNSARMSNAYARQVAGGYVGYQRFHKRADYNVQRQRHSFDGICSRFDYDAVQLACLSLR